MTFSYRPHILNSPGAVLKKKFLEPNRCSVKKFSELSGISPRDLNSRLNDGLWSHAIIRKISTATNTAPRYWYYLQSEWLFYKHKKSRKNTRNVEHLRVPMQVQQEAKSPGYILENQFLKPSEKNYDTLNKLIGVSAYALQRLVDGEQELTPLMAYRLGKSFDTDVQYWLDLRSAYEVRQLLKSCIVTDITITKSLVKYGNRVYSSESKAIRKKIPECHPGNFLLRRFLKPSGIAEKDWRHLFCVSTELFTSILAGKGEIPLDLIIKICRVFKTDVGFWIEMQNRFYAMKAERNYSKLNRPPKRVRPSPVKPQHRHPFQILIEDFLKPMHVPLRRFMNHIRVSPKKFDHFTRGPKKIDFELAIRIGQALDMDPFYWITLQLEYDIWNFEKVRGEKMLHLY